MSEPSPSQMIQWFRSKAEEFSEIADSLERTFNPSGSPTFGITQKVAIKPAPKSDRPASAEAIKEAIADRGFRVGGLAVHFSTTAKEIEKIITQEGSGLYIADRGWVKLDPTHGVL